MGVKKHMLPSDVQRQWGGAVRLVHAETLHNGKVTYRRYRAASRKLFEAIEAFLPEMDIKVQKLSFDECFLDVSRVVRERFTSKFAHQESACAASSLSDSNDSLSQRTEGFNGASEQNHTVSTQWQHAEPILHRLARELKAWMADRTGFAVSVGAGTSKLLAKLASKAAKPSGVKALCRTEALEHMWPLLPVHDLPSCGGIVADVAEQHGVTTALQLREALKSNPQLAASITDKCGLQTLARVRALSGCFDPSPVTPSPPPASIQSQCSFAATELTSAPTPIPMWACAQARTHLHVLVCDVLARSLQHVLDYGTLPRKLTLAIVAQSDNQHLGSDVYTHTGAFVVPSPRLAPSAQSAAQGNSWLLQRTVTPPDTDRGGSNNTSGEDTAGCSRILPLPTSAARWLVQQRGCKGPPKWLHALEGSDLQAAPQHARDAAAAVTHSCLGVFEELAQTVAGRLGWLLQRISGGGDMGVSGGAKNKMAPLMLTKLTLSATAFAPVRNTLLGGGHTSEMPSPAKRTTPRKRPRGGDDGVEGATAGAEQLGSATPHNGQQARRNQVSPHAASASASASAAAAAPPDGHVAARPGVRDQAKHASDPAAAAAAAAAAGFSGPVSAGPMPWAVFKQLVQSGGSAEFLRSLGVDM